MILPKVTVTVPTKDRPIAISGLLSSLCNQTLEEFNVIIALNSSDSWDSHLDRLVLALENKDVKTTVLDCIGYTFSELHQRMVSEADTGLVCRLDDDHVPESDYLKRMRDFITSNSNVGAVGGIVLHPEVRDLKFTRDEFFEQLESGKQKGYLNTLLQLKEHPTNDPLLVPDLYSTFMARKDTIEKVGGIATEYSSCGYREETDLTLRMTQEGYKQYILPQARTFHIKATAGGERNNEAQWKSFQEENTQIFNKRMEAFCPNIGDKFKKIWG